MALFEGYTQVKRRWFRPDRVRWLAFATWEPAEKHPFVDLWGMPAWSLKPWVDKVMRSTYPYPILFAWGETGTQEEALKEINEAIDMITGDNSV